MKTKRLRVFAGPNGSGKSTLVRHVMANFQISFGYVVNADEVERALKNSGSFDFSAAKLRVSKEAFLDFAMHSALAERAGQPGWLDLVNVEQNRISLAGSIVNSYQAALIADFLREKLLEAGRSFTFETVLSDARKLDFLQKAREAGYRVYLYYVATNSPSINLARVKWRAAEGGHDVPAEKITSRYEKSLSLLPRVIQLSNRAYLFDNSQTLQWVAEITDGHETEYQNGDFPDWVNLALNRRES